MSAPNRMHQFLLGEIVFARILLMNTKLEKGWNCDYGHKSKKNTRLYG